VDMREPAEKQGPIRESVEDLVSQSLAKGITVSLRSHFVLERVKNSHLC
jgi:hypothetical protein